MPPKSEKGKKEKDRPGSGRGKPKKAKLTVAVILPEGQRVELAMQTTDTIEDLRKLVQQEIETLAPDEIELEEENRWEKLILRHDGTDLADNEAYVGNLDFTADGQVQASVPKPPGGTGRFEFPNGALYEGEWEMIKRKKRRHGNGTLTIGGEKYVGQWHEGVIQGQGEYTFASGAVYAGEWVNSRMHGTGVYTWPNGCKYAGQWDSNRMSGEGVFTTSGGDQFKGKFENNQFINDEGHWVPEGSWPIPPPEPEEPEEF